MNCFVAVFNVFVVILNVEVLNIRGIKVKIDFYSTYKSDL